MTSEFGWQKSAKMVPKIDPKRPPGGQNGSSKQNRHKRSSKMDTNFDPAKTQKMTPAVPHKNTRQTLQKPSENAILYAQNTENTIKPL